jgi:hypothetical protein
VRLVSDFPDTPSPYHRPARNRLRSTTALALALTLLSALPASAAGTVQLSTETQDAFATYVRLTDARNDAERVNGSQLLWIDSLAPAERDVAYAAVRGGEVRVTRLETKDGGAAIKCPGGLIHHWSGIVFIPGATVDDALRILQDYDRHSTYYAPDVERSKLESRDGEHFRALLRFRRKKVITVVLDSVHDVHYFRDSPVLAHSRSSATRIAQVKNPGTPQEREKPPGDDDGFLWKMETWWRIKAAEGGVYVQSEVVSLTRSIPAGLGWLVGPFVTSIPKETLAFTLEATRKAVLEKKSAAASNGSAAQSH